MVYMQGGSLPQGVKPQGGSVGELPCSRVSEGVEGQAPLEASHRRVWKGQNLDGESGGVRRYLGFRAWGDNYQGTIEGVKSWGSQTLLSAVLEGSEGFPRHKILFHCCVVGSSEAPLLEGVESSLCVLLRGLQVTAGGDARGRWGRGGSSMPVVTSLCTIQCYNGSIMSLAALPMNGTYALLWRSSGFSCC